MKRVKCFIMPLMMVSALVFAQNIEKNDSVVVDTAFWQQFDLGEVTVRAVMRRNTEAATVMERTAALQIGTGVNDQTTFRRFLTTEDWRVRSGSAFPTV